MPTYLVSNKKTDCFGCRACEQLCLQKAIIMSEDKEGFQYPQINKNLCTGCNLCEKICPANYHVNTKGDYPKIYAAKNKHEQQLKVSSSGAMFSVLADYITARNGFVAGCVFENGFRAVHILTDDKQEIERMHGSKYIQSDTKGVYTEVKQKLENGSHVLFTGTPCQVDGLKRFLRKDYEKLLTADVVCHGVPSQKLFNNYMEYLEDHLGAKILNYKFRDKDKGGWGKDGSYTIHKKGKCIKRSLMPESDYYYTLFSHTWANRESCYQCPYASLSRVGDFTIADFWGITNVNPEFFSKLGVSLLLVNSDKADAAFENISGNIEYIPVSITDAVQNVSNFRGPYHRNDAIRNEIYGKIQMLGFENAVRQYCKLQFFRAKLRRMVPASVKDRIKQFWRGTL